MLMYGGIGLLLGGLIILLFGERLIGDPARAAPARRQAPVLMVIGALMLGGAVFLGGALN